MVIEKVCWYYRTSLQHGKAATCFSHTEKLFRPTLVRHSSFGRYPMFHTLTSVGRKKLFSMTKTCCRFFVLWLSKSKLRNFRKVYNTKRTTSLLQVILNDRKPRKHNCKEFVEIEENSQIYREIMLCKNFEQPL